MPRYYFDSRDGGTFIRDDNGLELQGIEAARNAAMDGLADLAHDAIPRLPGRELAIEVRDDRCELFRAALWFEMQVADGRPPLEDPSAAHV